MSESVREQILRILAKDSTVTEIKNQLPKVKSLGTIAYHLKELGCQGIITKTKEKKKQGQPTTYRLQDPIILKRINDSQNERKKVLLSYLQIVKNNPNIEDSQVINKLGQKGWDMDIAGDISRDAINNRFSVMNHSITPKGKKFLEENNK